MPYTVKRKGDGWDPTGRRTLTAYAGPEVGMEALSGVFRWRRSCGVPSASVNRAVQVGLANSGAWSPGFAPGMRRRPCRRRRAM